MGMVLIKNSAMVQYIPFLNKYHIWIGDKPVIQNIDSFQKAKELIIKHYPNSFAEIRDNLNCVVYEQEHGF